MLSNRVVVALTRSPPRQVRYASNLCEKTRGALVVDFGARGLVGLVVECKCRQSDAAARRDAVGHVTVSLAIELRHPWIVDPNLLVHVFVRHEQRVGALAWTDVPPSGELGARTGLDRVRYFFPAVALDV